MGLDYELVVLRLYLVSVADDVADMRGNLRSMTENLDLCLLKISALLEGRHIATATQPSAAPTSATT